ncbi:MAG: aryl-sulfate sulfotransferase [Proteobacteria bacterium]|nr:aryl-sulfate sulfotransferase [Pseudomonadota bacterium]
MSKPTRRPSSLSQAIWPLTLLALAGTVAGCGAQPRGATGGDSARAPTITRVEVIPNSKNILSATIAVDTDTPTRLTVKQLGQGGESRQIATPAALTTRHRIAVLGLYAATRHEFAVTASNAGGARSPEQKVAVTTSALPDDIPSIQVQVGDPSRMSPGLTLFGIGRMDLKSVGIDETWGMIVGVDQRGKIAWFQKTDAPVFPQVRRRSTGNLVALEMEKSVMEMDLMGDVSWRLTSSELGVDTLHHGVLELPSGNLLSLSTEMRAIDGYTDKSDKKVSYNVVGDVIVEFTPSGEVVKKVNLFDLLDPHRILLPDFHFPFWDRHYKVKGSKDWTHGNGITYDAKDQSYIVSLRHQNWIIKVDRASGTLVWKLGPDGDFTLSGPGDFPYHQHRPKMQASGTMMVYDNGNGRPQADKNTPPFTRIVEFAVDEARRQLKQVWEYRGDEPYFAPIGGDANRLPNGNVLIVNSAIVEDPTKPFFPPTTAMRATIVEVTYEPPSQKLLEITILPKPASSTPQKYMVGAAMRVADLYSAGEQAVPGGPQTSRTLD